MTVDAGNVEETQSRAQEAVSGGHPTSDGNGGELPRVLDVTAQISSAAELAEETARTAERAPHAKSLPVRQYLEDAIVPLLLQGMTAVAKDRPNDPVEYLAAFLLKHNPNKVSQGNRSK